MGRKAPRALKGKGKSKVKGVHPWNPGTEIDKILKLKYEFPKVEIDDLRKEK